MALMGIARIDAGEHWASDVLGGYLFGIVWLVVTVEVYAWGRKKDRPTPQTLTSGPDHSTST